MASQFLSQVEESALKDINRLIDAYKAQGRKVKHIAVTPAQYSAMQRIAKKAANGGVFDKFRRVDITETHYRGFAFEVKKPLRKKYRQDSTIDFIEASQ
jgi:hypothetical protein